MDGWMYGWMDGWILEDLQYCTRSHKTLQVIIVNSGS